MAEELTYNYSGVIKMSVNTKILAEKFVFSLRYCRLAVSIQSQSKAKMSRDRAKDIRQQLEQLDDTICNDFFSPNINQVLQQYDNLKRELQSLYEDEGKHAMFRAKCRWVEKGERPTKYFFNLEKKNYNKKTIGELRLQDESTTCNEQEILEQIEAYFKNLYSSENTFSQEDYEEFVHNLEIPRLSNEDRDSLEGPLTYEDVKKYWTLSKTISRQE